MNDLKVQSNKNFNNKLECKVDLENSNNTKFLSRSVNNFQNKNLSSVKNQTIENKNTELLKWGIKKIGLVAIGAIAAVGSIFIAYRFLKTSSPNPDPSLDLPRNEQSDSVKKDQIPETPREIEEIRNPFLSLNDREEIHARDSQNLIQVGEWLQMLPKEHSPVTPQKLITPQNQESVSFNGKKPVIGLILSNTEETSSDSPREMPGLDDKVDDLKPIVKKPLESIENEGNNPRELDEQGKKPCSSIPNPDQSSRWWQGGWIQGIAIVGVVLAINRRFNLVSKIAMKLVLPSQTYRKKKELLENKKHKEVKQLKNLNNGIKKKQFLDPVLDDHYLEINNDKNKNLDPKENNIATYDDKYIPLRDNVYYRRVKISRPDQIKLEATVWQHKSQIEKGNAEKKFLIFVNGNGEMIQMKNDLYHQYSSNHQINVIGYNNSGVMNNKNEAESPEDLKKDIVAVYDALFNDGILPENICVFGHSLGGSGAAMLLEEIEKRKDQSGKIKALLHFTFNSILNVVVNPGKKSTLSKIITFATKYFGKLVNIHISTSDMLKKVFEKDKKLSDRIYIFQSELDEVIKEGAQLIDDLPKDFKCPIKKPLLGHNDSSLIYQGEYYEAINKLLDIKPEFDHTAYPEKTEFEIKQNIINNYKGGLDSEKLLSYIRELWETTKKNENKKSNEKKIDILVASGIGNLFDIFCRSIFVKEKRLSSVDDLIKIINEIYKIKCFIDFELNLVTSNNYFPDTFAHILSKQEEKLNLNNLKKLESRLDYLKSLLEYIKKNDFGKKEVNEILSKKIEDHIYKLFLKFFKYKNPHVIKDDSVDFVCLKKLVISCLGISINGVDNKTNGVLAEQCQKALIYYVKEGLKFKEKTKDFLIVNKSIGSLNSVELKELRDVFECIRSGFNEGFCLAKYEIADLILEEYKKRMEKKVFDEDLRTLLLLDVSANFDDIKYVVDCIVPEIKRVENFRENRGQAFKKIEELFSKFNESKSNGLIKTELPENSLNDNNRFVSVFDQKKDESQGNNSLKKLNNKPIYIEEKRNTFYGEIPKELLKALQENNNNENNIEIVKHTGELNHIKDGSTEKPSNVLFLIDENNNTVGNGFFEKAINQENEAAAETSDNSIVLVENN